MRSRGCGRRGGSGAAAQRLAVAVVTALAERDALMAVYEERAGEALVALTDDEGMLLPEAVEWCGGQLSVREATRLRKVAADAAPATSTEQGPPAPGGAQAASTVSAACAVPAAG